MFFLQGPARLVDDPDLCAHCNSGYGKRFLESETLDLRKHPLIWTAGRPSAASSNCDLPSWESLFTRFAAASGDL